MQALLLVLGFVCGAAGEPSPGDLNRFPPQKYGIRCYNLANDFLRAAKFYSDVLPRHGDVYRRAVLVENYLTWSAHSWDLLTNCQGYVYSDEGRLYELTVLRNMIGKENYALGRMPEPLPWWYFEEMP